MNLRRIFAAGLLGALIALGGLPVAPASAQALQGLAVSACGTPGRTITAGQLGPITLDTNGNVCFSGSGGTSAVNLTQVGGAAVALGQAAMAASIPVAIASNQGAVPVAIVSAATNGATYARIAPGQATTVVKASAGTLYSICLNSAATATNTTTVYDNASGAGTIIAVPAVTTATVPTCLSYGPSGIAFGTGLTIITAAANGGDMTVAYK